MDPTLPVKTELNYIVGKILAAFRRELGLSQTALGERVGYDRSLIARIEVGRNVASIEDIYRLETMLLKEELIERYGDFSYLASQVAAILQRRGVSVALGRLEEDEAFTMLHPSHIERVVATVLDQWFGVLPDAPEQPPTEASSGGTTVDSQKVHSRD